MKNKSRTILSLTAVALAAGISAPAFAQSFDLGNGINVNVPASSTPSFLSGTTNVVEQQVVGGGNQTAPDQSGLPASGQTGGSPSFGSGIASGGAQGDVSRSSQATPYNLTTNNGVVGGRSVGLPHTSMNLMAPNSVNMSSWPSAAFKYGFPNSPATAFMGVCRGSIGGFLPPVSTASNDFNTVDCPIRGPLYPFGQSSSSQQSNINIYVPLPGGGSINGSINPQSAYSQVSNFMNGQ